MIVLSGLQLCLYVCVFVGEEGGGRYMCMVSEKIGTVRQSREKLEESGRRVG